MIIKTYIPENIKSEIATLLKRVDLGQRGYEDGTLANQTSGITGEAAVFKYLFDQWPLIANNGSYDGGFDIKYKDLRIDVKTQGRTTYVKQYYKNNVYAMQEKYDFDVYVFCSHIASMNLIEICGWIYKKDLHVVGEFRKKGSVIERSNGSTFTFRQDNYEVPMTSLKNIAELKTLS